MSLTRKALFLLLSLCPSLAGLCQTMYPVPMVEKIQQSSLIAEGKVVRQESFWNPQHTMIFTSSKVEVYKVFKGSVTTDTIEVMTQGGSVGGENIQASDLLTLHNNETGVFFCYPNALQLSAPHSHNILYDVYSSAQGVLKYDMVHLTANAPFVRFGGIETDLYTTLQKATGRGYLNKKPSFRIAAHSPARVNAPAITSFSPATVNAGALLDPTNNVLTITGTGFGAPGGSAAVLFDDPDDGAAGNYFPVAYNDTLIISWTNTSIQLRVPTNTGTGTFYVEDNAGNFAASPTPINVRFAVLDATFANSPTNVTKEINLMNTNGSGGYTIHYSTSTAGGGVDLSTAPEKVTFQRALATWKEVAGFNVIEGATTTNQVVNGSGTIMFDNTNTGKPVLAAGVLGVCYSSSSVCVPFSNGFAVQKLGFDIIIRNNSVSLGGSTFAIGPCPPVHSSSDLDLETVLLHELGHALNLGHIIDSWEGSFPNLNPNKLMNFAVVNGVKRTSPDNSAYLGALYCITPQGNTYGSCGLFASEMTPLATIVETKDECPASFPSTALVSGTVVPFDLVHATSNKNTDPQFTDITCPGTGTGVTNTAYYAFQTGASGILSMSVSGYGTTPASQSACTVAGIELALYQVSSCPAGQSYPTPVACRSFNANGAMTNITGLSASTKYLLMADGIDNTKAAFSITFGGASLPIKLQSFDGTPYSSYNQLLWTIGTIYNIQQIVIEKSPDGKVFTGIGSIDAAAISTNGAFKDSQPFAGDNYYRLSFVNLDGSIDYSNVILIKRKDSFLITAYPNPVRDLLYVDINGVSPGAYSLRLYNSLGQLVTRSAVTVSAYRQTVQLDAGGLPQGIYHLAVCNAKGIPVSETKIEVR